MTDGPIGLTQLLKHLEEGRGKMIKIISPFDAQEQFPDTDGPHVVTRGEECEGECDDPELHKLAHYVMDKFGWFEQVSATSAGGNYWLDVIHSYPDEVNIEAYVKEWAKEALKAARLPVCWRFKEK